MSLTNSSNAAIPTWAIITMSFRPFTSTCRKRRLSPNKLPDSSWPIVRRKLTGSSLWWKSFQNRKSYLNWGRLLQKERKLRTALSWNLKISLSRWNSCWSKNKPKIARTDTRRWQTSPPATIAATTTKLPTSRKKRLCTTWAPTAQASEAPVKTGITWLYIQPISADPYTNDIFIFFQPLFH